jgi:hypothetical protein
MSVVVDAIEGLLGEAAPWSVIDWPEVRRHVSRLQTRIVEATKTCSPGASRRLIKA